MSASRFSVSSRLGAALRAVVVAALLLASIPAAAADSLPAAPDARFATEASRSDDAAVSAWGPSCSGPITRCDDVHVFAATRNLRQAGIQPAVAAALAPATLVLDAVLFPFALALDRIP
jgi:hypothetical protein